MPGWRRERELADVDLAELDPGLAAPCRRTTPRPSPCSSPRCRCCSSRACTRPTRLEACPSSANTAALEDTSAYSALGEVLRVGLAGAGHPGVVDADALAQLLHAALVLFLAAEARQPVGKSDSCSTTASARSCAAASISSEEARHCRRPPLSASSSPPPQADAPATRTSTRPRRTATSTVQR